MGDLAQDMYESQEPSQCSHHPAPHMYQLKGVTGPWITHHVGGKLLRQKQLLLLYL